ncbi:MAG: hypothetical protein Q9216_001820 [Gyalolechia sp. 2 TL-2023]
MSELYQIPAAAPPPGAIVDFSGKNPLKGSMIAVVSVFMGLTFVFVGVRAYTKIKIHRRWSWDDGAAPQNWELNVATVFVKITFFILYWTIFRPFQWMKLGILGGGVIVTGVHAGLTLYILISASPRRGQTWLEKATEPQESAGLKLSVPLAAWTLATDLYIFLLPISGVLRLQLSRKKRFALLMVFTTGLGIYYRTLLEIEDIKYTVAKVEVLGLVEHYVGVMITCVPTTSVFLRHTLPPKGALRSKSKSMIEKLRHHLHFTQVSSSKTEIEQCRPHNVTGLYRNLSDRGLTANAEEAREFSLYTGTHTKTTVTAHPSNDYINEGIHVRTELEQV